MPPRASAGIWTEVLWLETQAVTTTIEIRAKSAARERADERLLDMDEDSPGWPDALL